MNKRLVTMLLASFLTILTLASCSSNDLEPVADPVSPPQETDSTTSPANDNDPEPDELPSTDEITQPGDEEPSTPPVFFFKIDDVVVDLNEDITFVLDRAGEPIGVLELPSCAFEGMDRVFRYPGADLYTYPNGDKDFVYTIVFYDDSVRTAEGRIRLGSSLQDVLEAYGNDYELDSDMYTFTRGLTVLEFLIVDNMVMGITYRFLVEQ